MRKWLRNPGCSSIRRRARELVQREAAANRWLVLEGAQSVPVTWLEGGAIKMLVQSSSSSISSSRPERRLRQQRVNLVNSQQRRKWSDWSECNENCFKTRHRTNCDDLLVLDQQQQQQQPSGKQPATTTSVQQGDREGDQVAEFPAAKLVNDQADDDPDYGDEGDDETETDSCASVDLSKTSEEIPCQGGRCLVLSKGELVR